MRNKWVFWLPLVAVIGLIAVCGYCWPILTLILVLVYLCIGYQIWYDQYLFTRGSWQEEAFTFFCWWFEPLFTWVFLGKDDAS